MIESIESEQKIDEWTPFSERPPEEEGRYLVTDDAGGVKTVQDDEFLYREDGTPLWLYSQNVTAWRPLPKPYRGEKDDDIRLRTCERVPERQGMVHLPEVWQVRTQI